MTGQVCLLGPFLKGPSGLVFSALSNISAPRPSVYSGPLRVIALKLVTSCSSSPGDKQGAQATVKSGVREGPVGTGLPGCWAAVRVLALEIFHKQDRVSSLWNVSGQQGLPFLPCPDETRPP